MAASLPTVSPAAKRRRGGALLEALVAMAILGTALLSLAAAVRGAGLVLERAVAADSLLRSADHLLGAITLWTRDDIELRLGERLQGPWRIMITKATPNLYVVLIADSTSHELLRTSIYHRAGEHEP
jgi:type II secretory pathway pseudopilin PulG